MRLPSLSLTALAFLLGSLAASASDVPKNPCTGDINKFCSGQSEQSQLAGCMKQHASDLSSGCKSWGKKFAKQHPGIAGGKKSSSGSNKKSHS